MSTITIPKNSNIESLGAFVIKREETNKEIRDLKAKYAQLNIIILNTSFELEELSLAFKDDPLSKYFNSFARLKMEIMSKNLLHKVKF